MLVPRPYQIVRKRVFSYILAADGVTSWDVASYLCITQEAAGQLLKRLYRQGWLNRSREPYSGYYVYTASDKLMRCFHTYPFGPDFPEDNERVLSHSSQVYIGPLTIVYGERP